jgi:hypothetical protein
MVRDGAQVTEGVVWRKVGRCLLRNANEKKAAESRNLFLYRRSAAGGAKTIRYRLAALLRVCAELFT